MAIPGASLAGSSLLERPLALSSALLPLAPFLVAVGVLGGSGLGLGRAGADLLLHLLQLLRGRELVADGLERLAGDGAGPPFFLELRQHLFLPQFSALADQERRQRGRGARHNRREGP